MRGECGRRFALAAIVRTRVSRKPFDVLVSTDDSPRMASLITAAACAFPWPEPSRGHGIVATRTWGRAGRPTYVQTAVDRAFRVAAARAATRLAKRWPDVTVSVVDQSPGKAILDAVERRRAQAVVVGWRGHGVLRRLFTGGSVARAVLRRAPCATLVVKSRRRAIRHFLVGIDGSASSRRAADLVARCRPSPGGRVTVVQVVEPVRVSSLGLMPSTVRATVERELEKENAARIARAQREVGQVAARLTRAGWPVRTAVRSGLPLPELLGAARDAGADVMVVGARGAGHLEGLLLGSVADGIVRELQTNVLVVR